MSLQDEIAHHQRHLEVLRLEVARASARVNNARARQARSLNEAARATTQATVQQRVAEATRHAKAAVDAELARTKWETRIAEKERQLQDAQRWDSDIRTAQQEKADRQREREQEEALARLSKKLLAEQARSKKLEAAWMSPNAFAGAAAPPKKYDVFISHAWEDKEALARPLFKALKARKLSVWFDEATLSVGDSLRTKIEEGVSASTFGVVILSHHFFAKRWPKSELNGLHTKQMSGEVKVILPIWHNISRDEIVDKAPMLADTVGLVSTLMTIDEMATEIENVVRNRPAPRPLR